MSVKKLHTNFDTFYYITFTCFNWLNLFYLTGMYDHIYHWFEILVKFNVYNCGYVIRPRRVTACLHSQDWVTFKAGLCGRETDIDFAKVILFKIYDWVIFVLWVSENFIPNLILFIILPSLVSAGYHFLRSRTFTITSTDVLTYRNPKKYLPADM